MEEHRVSHNIAMPDDVCDKIDRSRISARQMEILVEFLETNPKIARSSKTHHVAANEWDSIASILNCQGTGANKTPLAWSRYWNNVKSKLKRKAQTMSRITSETDGGPPYTKKLTQIELRILAILGPSFGMELPGVAVDPFPGSNTSSFCTTEPQVLEIISTVTKSSALESVPEKLDNPIASDMDDELIHAPPTPFMSNIETVFTTQPVSANSTITPEPQFVENPVPTDWPNGQNCVYRRSL